MILLDSPAALSPWANSPWQAGYERLWHTEPSVGLGRWELALDLREWMNEGLMALSSWWWASR